MEDNKKFMELVSKLKIMNEYESLESFKDSLLALSKSDLEDYTIIFL